MPGQPLQRTPYRYNADSRWKTGHQVAFHAFMDLRRPVRVGGGLESPERTRQRAVQHTVLDRAYNLSFLSLSLHSYSAPPEARKAVRFDARAVIVKLRRAVHLRDPGAANKKVRLTESHSLDLRFEGLNVFNHAQFLGPVP